jgi:hypothetical protein
MATAGKTLGGLIWNAADAAEMLDYAAAAGLPIDPSWLAKLVREQGAARPHVRRQIADLLRALPLKHHPMRKGARGRRLNVLTYADIRYRRNAVALYRRVRAEIGNERGAARRAYVETLKRLRPDYTIGVDTLRAWSADDNRARSRLRAR